MSQAKLESLLMCLICFLPFFRGVRFVTFLSLQDLLILFTVSWIFLTKFYFYRKYLPIVGLAIFITGVLVLQTLMVSDDPFQSTVNILKCLNCYLFLPLVLLFLVQLKGNFQLGIYSYISGAVASSIITLLGFTGSSTSVSRISGFAGDPVMYSILLSFAVCYLMSDTSLILKIPLVLRLLALAIIFIEILKTGSGSGLVIVVLAVFFARIVLRTRRTGQRTLFIDFGILILLGLAWTSNFANTTKERIEMIINPRTGYSLSTSSGHSTIESRIVSIQHAITQISEHPILGSGFSFSAQLTDLGFQPHNYFILAWLTGGVLLLSCTLVFLAWNIKRFLISCKRKDLMVVTTQAGTFFALMTNPILWDGGFFTALFVVLLKGNELLHDSSVTKKLH